jgi:hypothetical protein
MTRQLCLLALLTALVCAVCTPAQAVTFNTVFTDPHPLLGPGTIGFAYAGNKFVGSVQQDGTGALSDRRQRAVVRTVGESGG